MFRDGAFSPHLFSCVERQPAAAAPLSSGTSRNAPVRAPQLTTFSSKGKSDYDTASDEHRFTQFFAKTRERMMAELRDDVRKFVREELDEEIGCLFKEMGHLRASVATSLTRQRSLASGLAKVMAAVDELDVHDKFGFQDMRNGEFLSAADSEIDREWKAFFMINDDLATAPTEPLHEGLSTYETEEPIERGFQESRRRADHSEPFDDVGSEGKLGSVRTSQRQSMRPSNRTAGTPREEALQHGSRWGFATKSSQSFEPQLQSLVESLKSNLSWSSTSQDGAASDQLAQTFREV